MDPLEPLRVVSAEQYDIVLQQEQALPGQLGDDVGMEGVVAGAEVPMQGDDSEIEFETEGDDVRMLKGTQYRTVWRRVFFCRRPWTRLDDLNHRIRCVDTSMQVDGSPMEGPNED